MPLSSKRAYGRVLDRAFSVSSARLKRLGTVTARDAEGNLRDSVQSWGLTLLGAGGEGFVIYFTTEIREEPTAIAYRRPPVLRFTPEYRKLIMSSEGRPRSVPIGITSAQMLFFNPKSGNVESKIFRDLFTAQLILAEAKSELVGQVLILLPDRRRSFVHGAIKIAKSF